MSGTKRETHRVRCIDRIGDHYSCAGVDFGAFVTRDEFAALDFEPRIGQAFYLTVEVEEKGNMGDTSPFALPVRFVGARFVGVSTEPMAGVVT